MSIKYHTNEVAQLRETILSKCIWSDTYQSLKDILKQTANQLPLLISFDDNNDEHMSNNKHNQTILFFDRNVSNKILFTPLKPSEKQKNKFEVYPRHCTFAITDLFHGIIEFIRNGQRCSNIYTNLQQLIDSAANIKCSPIFMSRDSIHGYYSDSNFTTWTSKKYNQGVIFHAQRIHQSTKSLQNNHNIQDDYLECLDEEGNTIFLKLFSPGRYSLIATSIEQYQNQPEILLYSTQTHNISQLIKRLTDENDNNNNCIRLVRGDVPYHFQCQYLKLAHQSQYDILIGLTKENLVVEWNLDSHASCRYATNLNDILSKFYGTWQERILENLIDQVRKDYRENFQFNMQLISTKDWTAFFQYWKWTRDMQSIDKQEKTLPYQSRRRFHLVASIQDLSDHAESILNKFTKSSNKNLNNKQNKKLLTTKRHLFLKEMSKILASTTTSPLNHKRDRIALTVPQQISLLIPTNEILFDKSIYDSNRTSI